jgi:uncharacterized protein (TIGR02646 family)
MIKLERPPKPAILVDKEQEWLEPFLAAVDKYGGYKKIPKEEKDRLIGHYRHDQIKQALFPSSFLKCAFCEGKPQENGNIEVEHFFPKSIYPKKIFSWENFLPSCRKCNDSKLVHDTGQEPIINPYDDNPDDYFEYTDILIAPINENKKARDTITVCSLNSARLMKPRAEILISLHTFRSNLQEVLDDLELAATLKKKQHKLRKIAEAIEIMEQLTENQKAYSGYCKHYLNSCKVYQLAKRVLGDSMQGAD